ncbi:hypothetical protein AF72_06570 [Xylella taiwanensis]|nr:hypothetical protein AB672_07555 [Xylella taiwanensis]EWS78162.1 hypothetical protein AF72_06570 [Xylella taiwanensis]
MYRAAHHQAIFYKVSSCIGASLVAGMKELQKESMKAVHPFLDIGECVVTTVSTDKRPNWSLERRVGQKNGDDTAFQ